jgi:hypothetical protein
MARGSAEGRGRRTMGRPSVCGRTRRGRVRAIYGPGQEAPGPVSKGTARSPFNIPSVRRTFREARSCYLRFVTTLGRWTAVHRTAPERRTSGEMDSITPISNRPQRAARPPTNGLEGWTIWKIALYRQGKPKRRQYPLIEKRMSGGSALRRERAGPRLVNCGDCWGRVRSTRAQSCSGVAAGRSITCTGQAS